MGVRIVVLAAILFPPLVRPLLLPFGAMTAVTLGAAVVFLRRGRAEQPAAAGEVVLKNPFSLTAAVKFGLLFAVVSCSWWRASSATSPARATTSSPPLAGLTDVDAITLSMAGLARSGGAPLATVVGALVVAALANTLVKCGLVVAAAGAKLRRSIVAVTAVLVVVGVAAILLA